MLARQPVKGKETSEFKIRLGYSLHAPWIVQPRMKKKEKKVKKQQHIYMSLRVCVYLFVWDWYKNLSSSSYRAGSTDIPDPLSPLLPIVHRPR